eukprot:TRINITY_DN1203_c1_g3_i1.p1 TRINITY_DN1203_c1_g3~~TRINITY_DN1203_c1_g3_i1.p1  ORF type:complete len:262 (-),score=43.26 TRINITY_DN1203_c1_g3_i1:376-1098(-)
MVGTLARVLLVGAVFSNAAAAAESEQSDASSKIVTSGQRASAIELDADPTKGSASKGYGGMWACRGRIGMFNHECGFIHDPKVCSANSKCFIEPYTAGGSQQPVQPMMPVPPGYMPPYSTPGYSQPGYSPYPTTGYPWNQPPAVVGYPMYPVSGYPCDASSAAAGLCSQTRAGQMPSGANPSMPMIMPMEAAAVKDERLFSAPVLLVALATSSLGFAAGIGTMYWRRQGAGPLRSPLMGV